VTDKTQLTVHSKDVRSQNISLII